jgi:multiple sugar transport system permease protein
LSAGVDVGGGDDLTTDALYLGEFRFRELTFAFGPDASSNERDLGVFPLKGASQLSFRTMEAPSYQLTLTVQQSGPLAATWAKYTQNYREAWYADEHWPDYLFNSVWLVVLNVIGQLLACSMVAYAFARLSWPGRDTLFVVLLSTMMLPGAVTMIPVFLIFKSLGMYNTLLPLWLPAFFGTPFFIFLLRQFMLGLPRELEEAARLDGCSWLSIYWRIVLPLMKPALAAVAIFTFMNTWNELMGPLIYLSDERLYPLSLGLFTFRGENETEFGLLMAASTLMTLPIVALFFLCQRYFVQGVTLTGLKG